jgi:hypothetical protein
MILTPTKTWLISLFLVFLSNLAHSQCGITVTKAPANSTICLSGSVTITSTVSPSGSYSYQWQTSSSSAGVYSDIPGETNSSLTVNGTVAGTNYYKLNVVSAGCTTTTTAASVKTLAVSSPTVYSVTGGGSYCSGGPGVSIGLGNSDATLSYTLKRGATPVQTIVSSGGALTFNNQTTTGSYTVTATNGSCTVTMNGNAVVSINANPTVYAMSGGGSYCAGGAGLPVGLRNSQTGVNYQLLLSGSPVGSPVAGTGAAIAFGNETAAGTYTVVATNTTTSCTSNMSGTATITIVAYPNVYNVTGGGSYCSAGSGLPFGLDNSDSGVNYTLKRGATIVQTLAGTGNPLTYNIQTIAGTYSITASNGTCTIAMNGSPALVVNPSPNVYAMSGGGNYCTGGTGVAVGLRNSQSGVNYQMLFNGSPSGSPVAGTGSALSFGLQTTAGTYTAVATNATTSCTSNMSGTAAVSIVAYPNVYNLSGGGSFCSGGTGFPFALDNSDLGVNYTLQRGAMTIQTIAGTGSPLTYNNQTTAGTYTVTANNGTCSVNMNGSPTIVVNPNPTLYAISGGGGYCTGSSGVQVGLAKSQSGINYQLLFNGTPSGSPVAGTGAAISFGVQTDPGTYTAIATNTATSCTSNMTGSATVSINTAPVVYNVTGGGHYCSGGAGVSIGLDNSDIGINYTLKRGAVNVQIIGGTGTALTFNNQTAAGNYTVLGDNGGCTATMNGSATVIIDSKPTAFSVTGGGSYCPPGAGVPVGLGDSQTGKTYQLMDGANPVGASVAGNTGHAINFGNQTVFTTYTVIATNTVTSCTANMNGTAVVSDATPAVYNVTGGGTYCQGGSGFPINLSNSDAGFTYQLMMGGNPIGSALNGTNAALSFGNQTAAGSYSVIATNVSTSCSIFMNGNPSIIVNPLPTATITPSGPTTFCSGGSVTLTSSAAASYLWSTGETTQSIVVNASGRDSVTITDVNGCQAASAATVVTVNSASTPTITAGGPTTFCSGGSVTLTSSAASSYLWSTGATTQSIVVSSSGRDSVQITDVNGCQAFSAPTVVTVNSASTPSITPSGPTTFCSGGSVTLTSSAASSYLWSTGETTQSIVVNSSGRDSVQITDVNGCQAFSAATVVTVNSAATPTITPGGPTTFCSGGSVTLTSSAASSYLWSTGATTSSIVVSTSGKDSVTVTDVNGCQATSAPTVVTVNSCTFTWNGSQDTDWHNGANWDIGFAPDSVSDVIISSSAGQMPALTGSAQARALTINSSPAALTLNAASTLNVFGNFTNNGTFADNGGTTVFKGSSAQAVSGAPTFTALTLDNSSGLTLNSAVTVTGILSLLKGAITTNGNLTVDLNNGNIAYNIGDAGSISGNVKVQKNVLLSRTHYIACPVSGTTANDLNDNTQVINPSTHKTRLFTFDASTQAYVGISNLNTALSPMTGYSLFFTAATVLDYTGTYAHGATFPALTCSNAVSGNSILAGNPYPSTLDWNGSGWTRTGINDALYFWNAQTSSYSSYVNGSSTNGGTQYIPSLQAFYVTSDGTGGTASIAIDNQARVTSPNPSLFRKAADNNVVKVTLSNGIYKDEALIRFNGEATDHYDNAFDAYKMMNPDSTPSVFTGDFRTSYSINTLPKNDKVIPLNVNAGFSGLYTLDIQASDFDGANTMVLEDKVLNVKKKLDGNDQYTCVIKEGDRADRFNLIVSFSGNINATDKVYIGSYDKTVNVTFNNAGNTASFTVYDLMGKQINRIENADISSGLFSFTDPNLLSGIYVVKVAVGNELFSGKVFIK